VSVVVNHTRTTRRGAALLALVALTALPAAGRLDAQTVRWPGNPANKPRPVLLTADQVVTWKEDGKRVFLLTGRVHLEHGVTLGRMQQAVVWVDEEAQRATKAYRLEVYAEGGVTLQDGARDLTGDGAAPAALLELTTAAAIKVKTYGSRMVERRDARDPLYLRARMERGEAARAQPAAGVRQASAQQPAAAPPARPAQLTQVAPPQPIVPPPPPVPVSPGPTPTPVPPGMPVPPQPPAPQSPQPAQPEARPAQPEARPEPPRQVTIRPRSAAQEIKTEIRQLPNGETAIIVPTGVILTVTSLDGRGVIDIEADRLVFWTRGDVRRAFQDLTAPGGQAGRHHEFYLAGNVEIRNRDGKEERTLRCDEAYYDVNRSVAIAYNADLEIQREGLADPVHVQGPILTQVNNKRFELGPSSVNASKLPYGPGLYVTSSSSSVEEIDVPRRSIFFQQVIDPRTGQPETEKMRYFRGKNVVLWVEGVPVFYSPYLQGDAEDPLGPLEALGFNYNRVFGFQTFVTLDMYDLIGMNKVPGTRWRLNVDYLTERGFALGTDYAFTGRDLFGLPNRYGGLLKLYGIRDAGEDILGGDRGRQIIIGPPLERLLIGHPEYRGRAFAQFSIDDLPGGFSGKIHGSALSDRNFLEQYYLREYVSDLNQDTYAYVKQQDGQWAWTGQVQPAFLYWMTQTEWLPKFDGYWLGAKFFDLLTYNAHGGLGYARLRPADKPGPFSVLGTDVDVQTFRGDLWQELSLPFSVGDLRVVPYLVGDLTYYSDDVYGNDRSRFYAGGGVRSSFPLSRLYGDVCSELLNLNGLYHKIVFSSNYYNAHSNVALADLPQLDRLHDDASDHALRDLKPQQPFLNPGYGFFLANSPLYDPQLYALRRLLDNRTDTLDTIEVLQMGVRQRLQTKRGFPGAQHVIDWMTLDLNASYFPDPSRDNFGQSFAFLEYDWAWHVGDRLTFWSNGWYEPITNGPRVLTVGTEINRPDGTRLHLAYRHIDPIESRTVMASLSYVFSPKYRVTASTGYDFGAHVQNNALVITRTGSDLEISAGIRYDSILNNLGFTLEIYPNLLPASRRVPGGSGGFLSSMGRQ
jgi:hypothetical protein